MAKILRDIPVEKQIARHMEEWERRRLEESRTFKSSLARPIAEIGPCITISRELGSGGTELSVKIAERLGWQHFDREILEAIALRTHAREELVARFDEHVRGQWETYLRNLFTGQTFDAPHYLHHLSQVLLGVAHYGKAVILGRGANFILPARAALRLRAVAPMEYRIRRLVEQHGHDQRKAAAEINHYDREQQSFIQRTFHRDPADPSNYDLVINTAELGVENAVNLALQVAQVPLPRTPATFVH